MLFRLTLCSLHYAVWIFVYNHTNIFSVNGALRAFLKAMFKRIKKRIKKHLFGIPRSESTPEATDEQLKIMDTCSKYTMTSRSRQWALIQAVEWIAKKNIEGDIVECGVWKGGNLILCGLMLKAFNLDRLIWGYDTFTGMSEPTENDYSIYDPKLTSFSLLKSKWLKNKATQGINDWNYAAKDEVASNFSREVGMNNLKLISGKVEDTLVVESNLPEKISILRLDTDWYESTKVELDVLFPRLEKAGVLIIDDYGHFAGSRKAVDEFFEQRGFIWLHRVDYTCRLYIKQ